MATRRYQAPVPITRDEYAAAVRSGDSPTICHAVVSAACYEPDRAWLENEFLTLLATHEDLAVKRIAIIGLGHLARIHGEIDVDRVIPALVAATSNSGLTGHADDALSDIKIFVIERTNDATPNKKP